MLSRFARAADPGPFAIGGCAHFRGEGRHNYHVVFGFITHGNEDGTLPAALRLLDELKSGLLKHDGTVTLLLGNPEAAPAGVHDAQRSKESALVSAIGPADLEDAGFVDESGKHDTDQNKES